MTNKDTFRTGTPDGEPLLNNNPLTNKDLEQEIKWLKEEIAQDEIVRGSSDFTSFHEQRIAENRVKLSELGVDYDDQ